MPTAGDTLETFTLGDTNNVDHLILSKDTLDTDLLLKVVPGKVDLVSNRSTVELDFNQVSLLLPAPQKLLLGVSNQPDDRAVLLDLGKLFGNLFLANIILPLLASLGESLLFGLGPELEKTNPFEPSARQLG